jgi:Flp pilus assembly protein TadD
MNPLESIPALLRKANQAAQRQCFEESAALLERVLAQDSQNMMALDLFGFVRFFQNRFAEAEQYCRRALTLAPNHAYALKGLGLCLARQGRIDEGVTSLERAITLEPAWFDPYWDLSIVLMQAGRFEQALEVLAKVRAVLPDRATELESLVMQLQRSHSPS